MKHPLSREFSWDRWSLHMISDYMLYIRLMLTKLNNMIIWNYYYFIVFYKPVYIALFNMNNYDSMCMPKWRGPQNVVTYRHKLIDYNVSYDFYLKCINAFFFKLTGQCHMLISPADPSGAHVITPACAWWVNVAQSLVFNAVYLYTVAWVCVVFRFFFFIALSVCFPLMRLNVPLVLFAPYLLLHHFGVIFLN